MHANKQATDTHTCKHSSENGRPNSRNDRRTRYMLQGWPLSLLGFPGRLVPPDSGRIQSGISCYLGGPERSREGGVMGCFWSTAESEAGRLEPDLVMLQPPAPPAPRPPSARHVTAREQQENAEGNVVEITRQAPNRP